MKNICVKLIQRENKKYRKMLSSEETIFPEFDPESASTSPYTPGQHSKMTIGFALQTQRDKNTVLICYRIRFRQQTWTPLPVQSLTKSTICSLLMAGLSFSRMFPNQNWSRKKGLCILEKDLHIKQTVRKLS